MIGLREHLCNEAIAIGLQGVAVENHPSISHWDNPEAVVDGNGGRWPSPY